MLIYMTVIGTVGLHMSWLVYKTSFLSSYGILCCHGSSVNTAVLTRVLLAHTCLCVGTPLICSGLYNKALCI